jgi:hypothetical protein
MKDDRSEFQRFTDFMKAIVRVPKGEVAARSKTKTPESKRKPPRGAKS